MKKLFSFITLLSIMFFSNAQELDGVAKIGELNGNSIFVSSQGEIYIGLESTFENYIYLASQKKTNDFVQKLTQCRDLFIKYDQIAKKNNIEGYVDEFDIQFYFPLSTPTIYKRYGAVSLFFSGKPLFRVVNGKTSIVIEAMPPNYNAMAIVFYSADDFDTLIKLLSEANINDGIAKCKLFE